VGEAEGWTQGSHPGSRALFRLAGNAHECVSTARPRPAHDPEPESEVEPEFVYEPEFECEPELEAGGRSARRRGARSVRAGPPELGLRLPTLSKQATSSPPSLRHRA
jgi:hypothetical protein